MSVLFVSDIHLSHETAALQRQLIELLETQGKQAEQVFVLGDLFDFWFGDDAIFPPLQPVIDVLRSISDAGIPLYFMRGNRDFLIGGRFAEMTGCTLLDDPVVMELYGRPTLLMHGDLLCTDDHDYMQFRAHVRDPQRQKEYLALPLQQRIEMARQIQIESKAKTRSKASEIMDANDATVIEYMMRYKVDRLIHGHTHRPAVHRIQLEGCVGERIVLGDWRDTQSYLQLDKNRYRLVDSRVSQDA